MSLGHKSVQQWKLPDGWVISRWPAHPALVSEADFIAAQDISAVRGAILTRAWLHRASGCTSWPGCWRAVAAVGAVESVWSNGKPAYRCRHGHITASTPGPGRAKNACIREDRRGRLSGGVFDALPTQA